MSKVHEVVFLDDENDTEEQLRKSRQINDGDTVQWPMYGTTHFICCDCGLAHRFEVKVNSEKGIIELKPFRDEELTEAFRDEYPGRFPLWEKLKSMLLHSV